MDEKPMECFSCKKEGSISYREIIDGKVSSCKMCSDCPMLHAKFSSLLSSEPKGGKETSLSCAICHTSFEAMKMGEGLGCPKCYEVFEKLITEDLTKGQGVPLRPELIKKPGVSLHMGKTPKACQPKDAMQRLESLNSALAEALALENYEKAANLRDEIKQLMDTLDAR